MDTSRRFKDKPRGHRDTPRLVFGRCLCLSLRAGVIIIASLEIFIIGLGLFAVILFEATGQERAAATTTAIRADVSRELGEKDSNKQRIFCHLSIQYTTQYVTETQAVPHYVTQTQVVPQYVTETVPQYVTTTVQQEYVTVDQYCKPSGGYGYDG
ncbi:hypothetical protein C7M84_002742 [Penaeus vannamei]|uniref:Uncharacterized protein n=1 Tax=Penaeus vannamei TaxID=6689 RepID=A0A423TPZ1_PENVA|nr:hypothetical protein C7M84_002742 [Penaeus vannamei]